MTTGKNYSEIAVQWSIDVLNGEIIQCQHIKNACARFIRDLERREWNFYYDIEEAHRWCRFLELLPHVKGKWAAQHEKLVLSDWQIFGTCNIFGWRKKNNRKRRFNEAYIEVPRKNGKTLWFAGLGVGGITIDRESGSEIYCGAASERQAWEVFRPAKQICEKTQGLRDKFGIKVHAKTISSDSGGRFEPVIGSPGDGPSPSMAISDEFHQHLNSDQVDTFKTGMGAREQPLMLYITTAGDDIGGPCFEKHNDIIKILDGSIEDNSIFGMIFTIDDGDAWDTVEAQKKANPNYGISIEPDFLKGELEQARRSAVKQASYKTKHLDIWIGSKQAWMNMLAFQKCRKDIKLEDQIGRQCYIGCDLASKVDMSAYCLLFPPDANNPKWMAFFRYFVPESVILGETDTAKMAGNSTRYKAWHAAAWITATEGNITDFSVIEEEIKEDLKRFDVVYIGFDPHKATQIMTRLADCGPEVLEVRQTVLSLSEPMKEIESMILTVKLLFAMDPVIMWQMSNVRAQLDKKDNIYPNKEGILNKIDGVLALIMARRIAMLAEGKDQYYAGSGPIVI